MNVPRNIGEILSFFRNATRWFTLALSIAASSGTILSQSTTPSCNDSQSKRFQLPSIRFNVVDQDGTPLRDLLPYGHIEVNEKVWTGTGFIIFDIWSDPYWAENKYQISLEIAYDAARKAYVSAPVPNLWLPRHDRKCDRQTILSVTFLDQHNGRAEYKLTLPKSKKALPRGDKQIDLVLQRPPYGP